MLSGQAATSWLRFLVVRHMGFIEIKPGLDSLGQRLVILHGAEIHCLPGRCDRFRKSSGFGIRRRECIKNIRRVALGSCTACYTSSIVPLTMCLLFETG
jgi:hypothetical protein